MKAIHWTWLSPGVLIFSVLVFDAVLSDHLCVSFNSTSIVTTYTKSETKKKQKNQEQATMLSSSLSASFSVPLCSFNCKTLSAIDDIAPAKEKNVCLASKRHYGEKHHRPNFRKASVEKLRESVRKFNCKCNMISMKTVL